MTERQATISTAFLALLCGACAGLHPPDREPPPLGVFFPGDYEFAVQGSYIRGVMRIYPISESPEEAVGRLATNHGVRCALTGSDRISCGGFAFFVRSRGMAGTYRLCERETSPVTALTVDPFFGRVRGGARHPAVRVCRDLPVTINTLNARRTAAD